MSSGYFKARVVHAGKVTCRSCMGPAARMQGRPVLSCLPVSQALHKHVFHHRPLERHSALQLCSYGAAMKASNGTVVSCCGRTRKFCASSTRASSPCGQRGGGSDVGGAQHQGGGGGCQGPLRACDSMALLPAVCRLHNSAGWLPVPPLGRQRHAAAGRNGWPTAAGHGLEAPNNSAGERGAKCW